MNLGNSVIFIYLEEWGTPSALEAGRSVSPGSSSLTHTKMRCWPLVEIRLLNGGPNLILFTRIFIVARFTYFCVECLYLIKFSPLWFVFFFQNLVPGERTSLQHTSLVLSPQVTTHDPPVKSTVGSKQTASVNTSPSLSWLSNLTSGNVNKENKGMCGTGKE